MNCDTQHNGTAYSAIMLSVTNKPIMLCVIMENVVVLSVVMLNAVAPYKTFRNGVNVKKTGFFNVAVTAS